MPNKPSVFKQVISARINRELYKKLEILAKKYKMKMTHLLVTILEHETKNIVLTPEDYEEIAAEIRRAEAGAMPRQSIRKYKAKSESEGE